MRGKTRELQRCERVLLFSFVYSNCSVSLVTTNGRYYLRKYERIQNNCNVTLNMNLALTRIGSMTFAFPVRCSSDRAMKPSTLRAGQLENSTSACARNEPISIDYTVSSVSICWSLSTL